MPSVRPPIGDRTAVDDGQDEHELDYELPDVVVAEEPHQLKALADPTRWAILDLLLERSASVTELAAALQRPKSSVAHHCAVLEQAGMVTVVSTRKVRAITERSYGRTGRTIVLKGHAGNHFLSKALAEMEPAESGQFTLRHARIPAHRAAEFFDEIVALAERFTRLRRGGDVVHGFVAGVFPTALPHFSDDGRPDRSRTT